MSDKVDIEELDRLEREATKGPWEEQEITDGFAIDEEPFVVSRGIFGLNHGEDFELFDKSDVALICALRNAWPSISAELRELRDEVEKQKNLNSQLMGKIFAVKPELIELRARLEDDGK